MENHQNNWPAIVIFFFFFHEGSWNYLEHHPLIYCCWVVSPIFAQSDIQLSSMSDYPIL
jgi:hypothetical protein